MDNRLLLNIGAETDGDFVEISPEDGAVPDGRAVADGDLAGENHVGSNVCVDGDLREPLAKQDDLSLASVIPLHSIRRFGDLCRRFGGESAAEKVVGSEGGG